MSNFIDFTNTTNYIKDSEEIKKYLVSIRGISQLTREEEIELSKRVQAGDEDAFKRFVEGNLKLVITIANYYQNRGIELPDLVQLGNVGLMEAVRKYDRPNDSKFSSFAIYFIRKEMIDAIIENSKICKQNKDFIRVHRKVEKALNIFENKHGYRPVNIDEIAELVPDEPKVKIQSSMRARVSSFSIDSTMVYDDSDDTYASCIEDSDAKSDKLLLEKDNNEYLNKLLSLLNQEELKAIKLRFGIGCYYEHEYKEISKEMNIGVVRLKTVLNNAMNKMKRYAMIG